MKANGISDPDDIYAGDRLTIPDEYRNQDPQSGPLKPVTENANIGDEYRLDPSWWRTPELMGDQQVGNERRVGAAAGPVRAANGRELPTSRDGTPLYRQGDPEWGSRALGTGSSMEQSGCAVTATAMAVSKLSGRTITPGEMDRFLDSHHGYAGNSIRWEVAAAAGGLHTQREPWSMDTVNRQLDQGRPVVMGVDHKPGSRGGANGTDHWLTVTRRERDAQGVSTYFANDPATGQEVRFREQGGRLVSDTRGYKSTGLLQTFTGGRSEQPAAEQPVVDQQPVRADGPPGEPPPVTPPTGTPQPGTERPQLVAPRAVRRGQGFDLGRELTSPDSTLSVAIGNAEGTRTVNGGHTSAYGSHSDPGNGRRNLGTFSYQAHQNPNVRTPEQADQVQLARLRRQVPAYEAAVQRAGLDPSNPRLQAAYFDLWNQSPRMAGRFLDRLGRTMGGREPTVENLARARADSANDDRGRFTSTGLGSPERAYRDQLRRTNAIEQVLRARGAV